MKIYDTRDDFNDMQILITPLVSSNSSSC